VAVYTYLTIDEINVFLISKEIEKCIDFSPLSNGSTNSNYCIRTEDKWYVLTLFEEVTQIDHLVYTQNVLVKNEFPCAQIIKAFIGEQCLKNKPALLFTWIDGASVIKPNLHHCQNIGRHLALLHSIKDIAPQNFPPTKDLVWSIKKAKALIEGHISDDAKLIQQELVFLNQHRRLSLPSGLIHADCFRDNVLFVEEDGVLTISAIIDFEYASYGAFMYDLAIVINDWCSHADGSLDRLKMRDVIAAYNQVRPLESIENQSIPFMLRATAFRFWISRLSDGDKKSPDEFKRILLNRRLSLSGMQNN